MSNVFSAWGETSRYFVGTSNPISVGMFRIFLNDSSGEEVEMHCFSLLETIHVLQDLVFKEFITEREAKEIETMALNFSDLPDEISKEGQEELKEFIRRAKVHNTFRIEKVSSFSI